MEGAPSPQHDAGAIVYDTAARLLGNVERVVLGKREEIALVIAAMISGGHVLIEDVPGTAKTILARAIAQSVDGATFARIQCTPDLQPTDVTGLSIFNQRHARVRVQRPARCSRTSCSSMRSTARCRARSRRCSRRWRRRRSPSTASRGALPTPFLVIATENPIDQEGTFPLPEAQLDRFAMRTGLGYPHEAEEISIVLAQRHGHPIDELDAVIDADELRACSARSRTSTSTSCCCAGSSSSCARPAALEGVAIGASVRGSLTLERTARAWALLAGPRIRRARRHRAAVPAGARPPHAA